MLIEESPQSGSSYLFHLKFGKGISRHQISSISHKLCIWFMLCCGVLQGDFTHILQGYFTGTGAILWLPQCQWSDPEKYAHESRKK